MTKQDMEIKMNGWTFEETVKTAENLMKSERNMFRWDALRHLRDFAELFFEELRQYREIGTPEECRAAVEKQKVDKELESHDEKHILKSCLGLMQEMVNDFAEWYRWQHGEDSIEKLDEEERFCIRKTYFRIVQELFLLHTNHSGGTSTRAKCKQLGVDWGEEIEFDWSDEE